MMLWHHNARVNSHQRWKQKQFHVCFHLWCELTSTMSVKEWQVSWYSCVEVTSCDFTHHAMSRHEFDIYVSMPFGDACNIIKNNFSTTNLNVLWDTLKALFTNIHQGSFECIMILNCYSAKPIYAALFKPWRHLSDITSALLRTFSSLLN